MSSQNKLQYEVQVALATWCYNMETNGRQDQCDCPSMSRLRNASSEALTRLLTALETGNYHGDWKSYIDDPSPQNEADSEQL